jgi:hypothetical protein
MKTFMLFFSATSLVAILTFSNCGRPPHVDLIDYELSPSKAGAGEMIAPTQIGGKVYLGGDGVHLGHPESHATKTFTCGDGNRCIFRITVGSKLGDRVDFEDNENVQITFTWGNNGSSSGIYGTGDIYPKTVELPTCGPVTINISMIEGDHPGIKSSATIGPLKYWCEK